jgi:hypothetical protein
MRRQYAGIAGVQVSFLTIDEESPLRPRLLPFDKARPS